MNDISTTLKFASRAAVDVVAERERQKSFEGFDEAHDDSHDKGELACAAACYLVACLPQSAWGRQMVRAQHFFNDWWPWTKNWWKPRDRRRNLVKSAALIIAEIERMDRAGGDA